MYDNFNLGWILSILFGKNIFGWELIDTRISSFFKDELVLGSYLSRFFQFFLFLCILNFKTFSIKK